MAIERSKTRTGKRRGVKPGGWRRALLLGAIAASTPFPRAFTGEPSYRMCTEETQTCLDHMAAKLKNRGWLGIEYDDQGDPRTIKVTRVVPASPAETAGFKAGDLLVSVNGVKFADNTEDLCATCEATKDIWKPGSRVRYVVRRKGKEIGLTPTLAPLPSDVMAQIVGMHMLEHAQLDTAPKK